MASFLIPPPTIRNPVYSLRTVWMVLIGMGSLAPEPDSKYRNLIPMYSAAKAYMPAISGLSVGIPRAWPTNPAAPLPSPTMIYAVGRGSMLCFLTEIEPKAWAPVIKYGLSEFNNDINRIASAFEATPDMLPGKRITGSLVSFLMLLTNVSISIWSEIVDPPMKIAAALLFSIVLIIEGSEDAGVL